MISEEIYRKLLPTFTEEQLMIINSEKTETLNNKILIRILSLDEYNKYIINGTANGSINKASVSVWNMMTTKLYICANSFYKSGMSKYNPGQIAALYDKALEHYNAGNYIYFTFGGGWGFSHTYTFDSELICNNINENVLLNSIHYRIVVTSSWGDNITQYNDIRDFTQETAPKTAAKHTLIANVNFSNGSCFNTIYFNMNFRPVFQYMDNKKSIDIFK